MKLASLASLVKDKLNKQNEFVHVSVLFVEVLVDIVYSEACRDLVAFIDDPMGGGDLWALNRDFQQDFRIVREVGCFMACAIRKDVRVVFVK